MISKKSVTDFQFADHPQKLEFADYQNAKEKMLAHFKAKPDVLNIYSYGHISARQCSPGISDIDAIVVIDKLVQTKPQDFRMFANPTPADRYIFTHGLAYPVTAWAFRHLRSYFYFFNTMECETGTPLPIVEPSAEEVPLACLTTVLGGLPIWSYRLAGYWTDGYLPIRRVLKILSGHRYRIEKLKILGYTDPAWDQFSQDIVALRQAWFELPSGVRNERLVDLTRAGLEIHQQTAAALAEFMSQQGFNKMLESHPEEMVLELNGNRLVLFSDRLFKKLEVSLIQFPAFYRWLPLRVQTMLCSSKWGVIVFPRVLAAYFYILADFDNEFGRFVRARLFPSLSGRVRSGVTPFYAGFEKQAQIHDHYWQFLLENHLRFSCSTLLSQFIEYQYPEVFWVRMLNGINRRAALARLRAGV